MATKISTTISIKTQTNISFSAKNLIAKIKNALSRPQDPQAAYENQKLQDVRQAELARVRNDVYSGWK